MGLFVEIIEGFAVGNRYPLSAGARLGRTTGEILIKDAKISSLHAQVEEDKSGHLFLSDRSSSNGIRVRGVKVKRLALLAGVLFTIGKTTFKVLEDEAEAEELTQNREVTQESDSWLEILTRELPRLNAVNQVDAIGVRPIHPPILLRFIQGIQLNKTILVGYGPRKAGAEVIDIELLDPDAPKLAFEILPLSDRVMINVKDPSVLVNDQQVSSDTMKNGDKIRIGNTLIEVVFYQEE